MFVFIFTNTFRRWFILRALSLVPKSTHPTIEDLLDTVQCSNHSDLKNARFPAKNDENFANFFSKSKAKNKCFLF